MPVTSYSRTPASNNSAPPNGAPEGWAPSAVNNTVRQIMTDVVNEAGKNSAKVLGSVAGTNTVTATMSPTLDSYSAGMIVVLTPANTNSGAVTLNIDGRGACDIVKEAGAALVSGDLVAGVPALLVADASATDFILINPQVQVSWGSYSPTLTNSSNVSSSTSAFCQYMRVGSVVTVSGSVLVTCTSGVGTSTTLGVSLPIASNFAGVELGGAGVHNSSAVGAHANTTSDRADLIWFASSASSHSLTFSFTYRIV
jgi:hypothetical protein